MNRRLIKCICALMLMITLAAPVFAQDSKVYWQSVGSLYRANLDGSTIEGPFSAATYISNFVVDNKNSRIFFKDNPSGKIYRAELDLSNPVEIFTTATHTESFMDYDTTNDKLILSDYDGANYARIFKLDPDGSNSTLLYQFVPVGLQIGYIDSLKLHSETNKIYFLLDVSSGLFSSDEDVYSIDLSDGSNQTLISDLGMDNFVDITVTDDGSKLYLGNSTLISEINLATLVKTDYPQAYATDQLAFSKTLNRLFIDGSSGGNYLSTVNTDGTNKIDIITGVQMDFDLQVVDPYIVDACPEDDNKIEPGICGCGVADTDSDGDGTADCLDLCPSDPSKVAAGVCGCGVADTDTNSNGIIDCRPEDPLVEKAQEIIIGLESAAKKSELRVLIQLSDSLVEQARSYGNEEVLSLAKKIHRGLVRAKFLKRYPDRKKEFRVVKRRATQSLQDLKVLLNQD